jgi:hypothetical protein
MLELTVAVVVSVLSFVPAVKVAQVLAEVLS